jgi:hypothetical protein
VYAGSRCARTASVARPSPRCPLRRSR